MAAGDPLADVALLQEKENLTLIVKDGKVFKDAIGGRVAAGV